VQEAVKKNSNKVTFLVPKLVTKLLEESIRTWKYYR